MDTFENNNQNPEAELPLTEPEYPEPIANAFPAEEPALEIPAETEPVPEEPTVYHGTGTRRKESPYANSPYVMQHPQEPAHQPAPKKKAKIRNTKPSGGFWKKAMAAVLVAALMIGSCAVTASIINNRWDARMTQTEQYFNNQIQQLQDQLDAVNRSSGNSISGSPVTSVSGLTPAQVYAQNVDSVVAISTVVQTNYFGQTAEGTSAGSGFILSADGYVITNYHVVEGASSVSVILHDGTEYAAKLVGYDSTNDVAVLKVETQNLPAAKLGSSSNLIIGDMVVAIGNPLGELASTQTVGYVSGIGREVSTDGLTSISMIQTDAAINPGNSGGPLFNMNGEVIGITTAKYSGTTTSGASIEGIGFAIPIDDVVAMIDDLIDYGYVTGAYLGVSVQNVDESSAAMYNLPTGAYVVEVVEGVSAHRAGVQPKDIIVDLGGYEVTNVTTLTRALRNFRAGDTTTITVIRSGARIVLDITLDEKPGDLGIVSTEEEPTMPSEGEFDDWYEYFRRYFGE